MSAEDIALIIGVVGIVIAGIIFTCGLFSSDIVDIIRAFRGEDDE